MRKKQGLGMPCQVWINRKTKEKYLRERISCSFSKEEHDAFIQETSALSSSGIWRILWTLMKRRVLRQKMQQC
ncbi:hypothetical protein ACSBR2_038856 [Camellia fascicularis]